MDGLSRRSVLQSLGGLGSLGAVGTAAGRVSERRDRTTSTPRPVATVTFNDQSVSADAETQAVTVSSVSTSDGGFVAIHRDSAPGPVIGVSDHLSGGRNSNVRIALDEHLSEETLLVAMPHLDTDGDDTYEFDNSGQDRPYTTSDGAPVVDDARVQIARTSPPPTRRSTATPTPTATRTPTVTRTPTATRTPTPTATPISSPTATPTATEFPDTPAPTTVTTGGSGVPLVPVGGLFAGVAAVAAAAWRYNTGGDDGTATSTQGTDGGSSGSRTEARARGSGDTGANAGVSAGTRTDATATSETNATHTSKSGPQTGDEPAERQDRLHGRSESVASSETDTLGPPQSIPRVTGRSLAYDAFEKEEVIGRGGNADVYRVVVPSIDEPIAVKEPRVDGTLHSETVARLLSEAETWDRLDTHDHVVGVLDWGADPLPWIAMEYMDGGHLGGRADEFDFDQRLWTAIAVTKAVRHAHRRGVAHLDLKPANVLFRAVDGAWDVPKVADWGLSKQLLDHSKSVEGFSPQYAAPEQFDDGYGAADDVTDVYQLGAVFYELFTGRPPFDGPPASVMREVLTTEPTPPSEVADLPVGIDEILLRALATEKADRYESVLYLRDDLQKLYEPRIE